MQKLEGLREKISAKIKLLSQDPSLTEEQRAILKMALRPTSMRLKLMATPTAKEMKTVIKRMLEATRNDNPPSRMRGKGKP